ncbi:MAG: cytochrome P450 [Actinomycetota bacterium]
MILAADQSFPVLTTLVLLPAAGALVVALLPAARREFVRPAALLFSTAAGAISLYVLGQFETGTADYQFEANQSWISSLGISWHLGVDGISLFLVVLTGILFPIALLATDPGHDDKPYFAWLLLLEAGCLGAFVSLDLFVFFIFFEIVLVPMYFLIGGWGHGNRTYAATKFFLYTMFGSALMLVGILSLVFLVANATGELTFDLVALSEVTTDATVLAPTTAMWIFASFALAFAVKVPLSPIVMMDPPDHTAMRRHVSRAMTPRRVAAQEQAITDFVDERLDRIDGATDIVEALFKPLPSFVVAHFLGVPPEDRGRFDAWTEGIVAANAGGDLAAASAMGDLFGYALELIERRKVDPGEDLVSDMVGLGEDEVSAMWIVGFVFTMVTGGNDTTTGLLGGASDLLTRHRDQRARLLEDRELLPGAVEEFLRLTSPVQNLARTTTRPVERHGQAIPEGVKVVLLYGAANRDEREFGPDADALDVERDIARHLALGYGAHHCLGAAAARLQARVALDRLLERFPDFEVDGAAGRFAPGPFVRRFESLPFRPGS